jgi:hypothetical protein
MALRPVLEQAAVGVARQKRVFEALRLLLPFDLPHERKIRIGRPGDGSYVVVDRLRATQPVMSFGIGPSLNFETAMAERGHDVIMFDHTVAKLPEAHPRFTWIREGVASQSNPGKKLLTLPEHMKKLPPACDAPILKLDVEGYEWGVIDTTPVDLLIRFEQIGLELHGLKQLEKPDFNAGARRVLAKLAAHFTLCHVHANNFNAIGVLADCFPFPETVELSYIRSDLVTRVPSATTYPTAIDAPNYHQFPEISMWFYPFLPGSEAIEFSTLAP